MPYTRRLIPAWAAHVWPHLQLCMTSLTTALIISLAIRGPYDFPTLMISSELHRIYSYLYCAWRPGWFPSGDLHECFNERKLILFDPLLNSVNPTPPFFFLSLMPVNKGSRRHLVHDNEPFRERNELFITSPLWSAVPMMAQGRMACIIHLLLRNYSSPFASCFRRSRIIP